MNKISKNGLKQNLNDREYRKHKQIWKKISNIYYEEDSDLHHNTFVSIIEEIAETHNNNGWLGIYNIIKHRKGRI